MRGSLTSELILESLGKAKKISKKHKNGDCYVSAYKTMQDLRSKGIKNAVLVHGLVTGQGEIEGIVYGHAWVELNGVVIDNSNGREIELPIQFYYALGKIKITRKYSFEDMIEESLKHETYGPWDKVFNGYP